MLGHRLPAVGFERGGRTGFPELAACVRRGRRKQAPADREATMRQ